MNLWYDKTVIFDSNICRFCGSTSKDTHPIQNSDSSGEDNGYSIHQLIKRLVPLKIELNDQKPQQVCCDCIATLQKYDEFISTCLANDITFENIIQSIKSNESTNRGLTEWPQDGKTCPGDSQSNTVLVLNKLNENSEEQNENLYILVELNCKTLNIDSDLLKCNENKSSGRLDEENVQNELSNSETNDEDDDLKKTRKKVKPFKCTICNKSLTRKSNLTSHLALHSKERPHKCNECGKNFAMFSDLNLHKHIHNQSFACKICKKCFVTKSKLERHGKSHSGVKEHACPICKKRFAEKNNMMAHMSVHTGERPFSCSVCKKSFRTQSHLTDHRKVHSAESPFKCTMCNKSFKWKSNLKDHSKFHSGEKFKCTDCTSEFSIRTDYYKHRKECRLNKNQDNSI